MQLDYTQQKAASVNLIDTYVAVNLLSDSFSARKG